MGVGFANTTKVNGILGTYDDRNQTTHKGANIRRACNLIEFIIRAY